MKKKAFTLIELLVVATIITILVMVVVVNLDIAKTKSRDAQRKTDLSRIAQALDTYKVDTKSYPDSAAFADLSGGAVLNALVPSYIDSIPTDPRHAQDNNKTYKYKSTGSDYKLVATLSETITDVDLKISGVTCTPTPSTCCTIDVVKKKAGDYCNPVNNAADKDTPQSFQVSSSHTALSW